MAKLSEMTKEERKLALNTMWNEVKSDAEHDQVESNDLEDPLNPFWHINFGCG